MTTPRSIPTLSRLDLRLTAPPSKSVTQRALIAASLADGVSVLRRPLLGDAGRHMVASLGACGAAALAAKIGGARGLLKTGHDDSALDPDPVASRPPPDGAALEERHPACPDRGVARRWRLRAAPAPARRRRTPHGRIPRRVRR